MDVREQIQIFLRSRPDLNIDHLTAYTSLSPSTGRGFLNGTIPRCDSDRVCAEFERVLQMARCGEILAQATAGQAALAPYAVGPCDRARCATRRRNFYHTSAIRRVAEVLDYCAESASIGVITGDYGIGKTEGVKAWRAGRGRRIESIVMEFDGFTASNRVWFLDCLAGQLGVPAGSRMSAGRTFCDVCDALRNAPCLLIFDQAEMGHVRVLQLIRQIHDRTHTDGVGVVLLSAPPLLARLTASRVADLGALTSRISVWAPLTGLAKPEMAAILRQEGIEDVDEAAFDLWFRATGGSMRRLMRAIDLIQAKHAGKRVTVKTIAGVASHLWGIHLVEGAA